ncbi:MAG: carboxypeptidase regulatory-like domain-containing protein [Planctomycetota bacterium]
MKRTFLLAGLIVLGIGESNLLAASQPKRFDLDGREVVVRVHRDWLKAPQSYDKVFTTITGRVVRPEVDDVNSYSTVFGIHRQDQKDKLLKQVLEKGTYEWSLSEDGPKYYVPVTSGELSGRKVMVRLYNNPDEDPEVFDERVVTADGHMVKLDFGDIDRSVFVAICGQDQKDKVLRELLGNAVFGWRYNKRLEFFLPYKPAAGTKACRWTIVDALGAPVPNAEVKVYLKKSKAQLLLAKGTADAEGQFETSVQRPSLDAFWYRHKEGAGSRFWFMASAVGYGTAVVEPFHWPERLFVPLVARGTEADERSIWGVVVDQNDQPVEGALVRADGVVAVGAKGVPRVGSQRHGVLTDKEGRFRTYVPIAEHVDEIGTLIPTKAKYAVRIEPPAGRDLAPFLWGLIPNGQHSKITLDYAGYYHTFIFEDENGLITDPRLLEGIGVKIERQGPGGDIWLSYRKWKDGGFFPLGKYIPRCERYTFQPLEVASDSPEQLVFRLAPARTYYGRVVDGTTGKPMSGASVRISRKDSVHTDQNGSFEVTVSPKAAVDVIYVTKENYLKVRILYSWVKRDGRGRYQFPEVKLFPAATVVVEPVGAKHSKFPTLFFRPQWFLVEQGSSHWAQDLLAACGKHPQDGIYRDFRIGGRKGNSFPVPAGVPLRINLRVLGDIEWAPTTITDYVKLKQGQVYDAGRHEMTEPFKVFVEVLDSAGKAVEGVPVVVCGDHDPAISSSGEDGLAYFDFVGYSKGEFIVECTSSEDASSAPLRQSLDYEISGPEDANSMFTLELSDGLLQHLFK